MALHYWAAETEKSHCSIKHRQRSESRGQAPPALTLGIGARNNPRDLKVKMHNNTRPILVIMLDCTRFRYSSIECMALGKGENADNMINNNDYIQEMRLSSLSLHRHDTIPLTCCIEQKTFSSIISANQLTPRVQSKISK